MTYSYENIGYTRMAWFYQHDINALSIAIIVKSSMLWLQKNHSLLKNHII